MLKLRFCYYGFLFLPFVFFMLTRINLDESGISFNISKLEWMQLNNTIKNTPKSNEQMNIKFILLWNGEVNWPFINIGHGRKCFTENKCPVDNCFVTSNRTLWDKNYRMFDAIIFDGREIMKMNTEDLPAKRLPHQKFIFFALESAQNYPVDSKFDGFFNWTWTYKLDSDAHFGYFTVHNMNGEIIGPKPKMHWSEVMEQIGEDLKKKLKSKKKAAAWFVSNCVSKSGREDFVKEVNEHLNKYGLTVDIYGACGPMQCPRDSMVNCLKILEHDYYFYFSFENSFSDDYVTEKLTHALQHDTVPVVFGGANYTRFMPDGIYLNARELGPELLANTMHDIMLNTDKYYNFFRYKKHYSWYRETQPMGTNIETVDVKEICTICSMLNNNTLVHAITIYNDFRSWWNPKPDNKI